MDNDAVELFTLAKYIKKNMTIFQNYIKMCKRLEVFAYIYRIVSSAYSFK